MDIILLMLKLQLKTSINRKFKPESHRTIPRPEFAEPEAGLSLDEALTIRGGPLLIVIDFGRFGGTAWAAAG